ncbi:MAG TPA: tyrosine-type recombinase/integrase, partial [Polyangiaceae bacterium]|nr:tyrosine-type recombinase/integrase [Polyangiaceae bacterium]
SRLEDKGLAPQTRRNALSLLRTIFRQAHELGHMKANPCIGVRVKGKDKDAWTYLTREEMPRFLAAFDPIERHLAAVQVGTGVRPGELVTLRRADVHLDDRPRIVIRYGAAPDVPTKTGAVRTVHLFGLALIAMQSWMGLEAPKRNPHGLVFPRERGGFRDENHVIRWEAWKAVLERAGLKRRFRWYDLRHTCASWLVSGWWGRRWSLQEVKEMLGHTSITITQRYAHLAASASEEAARLTGLEVGEEHLSGAREEVPALPPKRSSGGDEGGGGGQVRTSQQPGSGSPEVTHPKLAKTSANPAAPPTRVELVAFGLGIHRFDRISAEIPSADLPLTTSPPALEASFTHMQGVLGRMALRIAQAGAL